jgi:hypothetical protein
VDDDSLKISGEVGRGQPSHAETALPALHASQRQQLQRGGSRIGLVVHRTRYQDAPAARVIRPPRLGVPLPGRLLQRWA